MSHIPRRSRWHHGLRICMREFSSWESGWWRGIQKPSGSLDSSSLMGLWRPSSRYTQESMRKPSISWSSNSISWALTSRCLKTLRVSKICRTSMSLISLIRLPLMESTFMVSTSNLPAGTAILNALQNRHQASWSPGCRSFTSCLSRWSTKSRSGASRQRKKTDPLEQEQMAARTSRIRSRHLNRAESSLQRVGEEL